VHVLVVSYYVQGVEGLFYLLIRFCQMSTMVAVL